MTKPRGCDSCQLVRIQGMVTHEIGCPKTPRQCKQCKRTMRQGQREFCNYLCRERYYR